MKIHAPVNSFYQVRQIYDITGVYPNKTQTKSMSCRGTTVINKRPDMLNTMAWLLFLALNIQAMKTKNTVSE